MSALALGSGIAATPASAAISFVGALGNATTGSGATSLVITNKAALQIMGD